MGESRKAQRKKATERFYLETFLRLNSWPHQIVDDVREQPDFLLGAPGNTIIGVEIVNLYKDEGKQGSPQRQDESLRSRNMRLLCSSYYDASGLPAKVGAILPEVPYDAGWITKLTRRLRMARPTEVWKLRRFQINLGKNKIATFFITALPEEVGNYDRWTCVNNSVGWSRTLSKDTLTEKIRMKAVKLGQYAEAASQTVLLIVVEVTQESGMFDFKPFPELLPSQGFSEVHLLLHPLRSFRIA